MKVTYEFDTDKEDQLEDLKIFQQAIGMSQVLWDFSQYLRQQDRYIENNKQDSIEDIRETLYEMLSEYNVIID